MAIDWWWASDFLSRGRKKYERPLYDRGLRIWKLNKWSSTSDIGVGWQWSGVPFITYHNKDNSTTIQVPNTGSWNHLHSQSVRLTIVRYSGIADLYQRNFKFYLVEQDAGLTPAKIQGCRQCAQTGLVDNWCYPTTCYKGEEDSDGSWSCEEHPDLEFDRRWHYINCSHGLDSGHLVKRSVTCHFCNGTKKRDYGSKRIAMQWDGSPLRLKEGKIIKSAATLLERMVADYVEPIA